MQSFYDLKQSFVRMYRDYEYSAVVIITMALTLAIALFLFSLVYAIQYKPLPQVQKTEDLAWATLFTSGDAFNIGGLSDFNYLYLRQHQTTLDVIGRVEERGVTLSSDQFTEQYRGAAVSPEVFHMLGINAHKGRVLLASDDVYGAEKNVVISFELWDALFNRSPDVLQKTVKLEGEAARIVGVMPQGFAFPIEHDLWFAHAYPEGGEDSHGGWNSVIGRVKPGVQMLEVEAEFQRLMQQMKAQYPNQYKGKDIAVMMFTERFADNMSFFLVILKIAGVAILLMGCFSVSNLIIVRNLENAKEALIKTALGVPVFRVVTALLMETFWLCLFAAVIGIWLCYLVIRYFGNSLLEGPYWWTLTFEPRILLAGIAAGFFTWLVTGVIPLWMAARKPTNGLLSSGRKGGTGTALSRVMQAFSTLQIFCAFVLMVFTGVIIGGLLKVINADYGVPREGYLTAEIKLSAVRYEQLSDRVDYYKRFVERAREAPGIQAAGLTGALPGGWGYMSTFTSTERAIEISGGFPKANEMPVDENYFALMEMPVLQGRNFTPADDEHAEPVAIINESMARVLFPGSDAVGRQFQYNPEEGGELLTVIGVVPDVVSGSPLWYLSPASVDWRSQLYRPVAQKQPIWDSNALVFRTEGSPYDYVATVKNIAREIDPETPLYNLLSYEDFLERNESGLRRLIYTFLPAALLALAISALGIYSITRRVVLQSTPDIGIMRAIGIHERQINGKYMLAALVQLFLGLAAGVAFAFAILPNLPNSVWVASLAGIFWASLTVAGIIALLVLIASYLPLLGAHRLSPRAAMNFLSVNNE